MADETVEIKITGDSSDLSAAMADVAKRIELLVDALSGTAQKFSDVGKDAEKSMAKIEKSAEKVEKSTKKMTDKVKASFEKMKPGLESAADAMGRVDSSLSSFAAGLDHVSPKMAEFTRLAADAASMGEQMILAFTQAPGVFILTAAAVTALGLAWKKETEALEFSIEHHKKLGEAYDRAGAAIEKQKKRTKEYRKELAILTNAETDYEQALKEGMDLAKASEARGIMLAKQRHKLMMRTAATVFEQERANEMLERGIANAKAAAEAERGLVNQLFEHAKAAALVTEEEQRRAELQKFYSSDYIKMAAATGSLGSEYKVFVKEMTAGERALDSSADAHQKMSGGLILNANLATVLGGAFAESHREMFGTARTLAEDGGKSYDRFKRSVDTLNLSYKEQLGITEDVFQVIEQGGRIYGVVNRITTESIGIWDAVNLAIAENIKRVREKAIQDAKNEAKWKAWRDQRNALLQSIKDENAAIQAQLSGPYRELEQSYESQIEDLDEIIAKYKESAKENKKSAELVKAAEKKKALVTAQFIEDRQKLRDEDFAKHMQQTRDAAKEAVRIEQQKEAAIENIRKVSNGREAESYDEKLQALKDYARDQFQQLKMASLEARDLDVEEVDRFKAVQEEKKQIYAEYLQAKERLEDESREREAEKRLQDIQLHADSTSMLLSGTADAFMAIAENADQMSTEQRRKMFYIAQAAAMGEVAISGIVAIANIWEAHAANPIAAGVMTAGMAGITAAQLAMIGSQEPSFDIGGVVRGGIMAESPDQVGVNVLPGESVLNRSATERLGEQGVNALNSGGGMGQEIIVVPAYRHFDRFIKDEYRKGGAFRRFFNDAREYPVGQRSY